MARRRALRANPSNAPGLPQNPFAMGIGMNSDGLNSGEIPSRHASFPRKRRLLNPAQFHRVFKNGKRIKGKNMTLIVAANELNHPRLGLAVSKKALSRAVQRNRIKRLVRESFRRRRDLPAADFVFMAQWPLGSMNNAEIIQRLAELWAHAR